MLIGARTAAWSGDLPAGCHEVKYLQSNGNSYVDTLINPDSTSVFEFNFACIGYDEISENLFGMQGIYNTSTERFDVGNYNGKIWLGLGSGTDGRYYDGEADSESHHYIVNAIDKTVTRDDFVWSGKALITAFPNFWLFARRNMFDKNVAMPKLRNGVSVFYKAGVKVAEIIPVRKVVNGTSIGYMYDKVTGEFLETVGDPFTGDMIGPDVT